MNKTIIEGLAKIKVSTESKISKKLPVFYNPVMKFNRDTSILLLKCIPLKDLQVALPLAGSGIRGYRMLKELPKNKIKTLFLNDYKDDFFDLTREHIKLNEIEDKEIVISSEDANLFILQNNGFDYIDLDPFGTPNPFLDSAAKRISRNGIFAITATDTSALSGTYHSACVRKYWAVPKNDELKHETGLRILIRKIQLVGAQFDKALTPIYSYSKDHYMRVVFRASKGKTKVDKILKQHKKFNGVGPVWVGKLWNTALASKMAKKAPEDIKKFLDIISNESKINVVGFYDIHTVCKKSKITVPPFEMIMDQIKQSGFKVSRTHFSKTGIRSDIDKNKLLTIIKSLNKKILAKNKK